MSHAARLDKSAARNDRRVASATSSVAPRRSSARVYDSRAATTLFARNWLSPSALALAAAPGMPRSHGLGAVGAARGGGGGRDGTLRVGGGGACRVGAGGAPGTAASFAFCRWRAALRRRFFSRRAAVRRAFSSAVGAAAAATGGGGGAAAGGGARGGSGGGGGSATKRPLSSVWPVALFQSFELAFFSLRSIDDFFCAPPLFSGCIGRRIDGHGAASTRPAALRRAAPVLCSNGEMRNAGLIFRSPEEGSESC
jgi:hypothetical protein